MPLCGKGKKTALNTEKVETAEKEKKGKGGVKVQLKSVERDIPRGEGVKLQSVAREDPVEERPSGSAGSAGAGVVLKTQEEVVAEETEVTLNEIERLTEDNIRELEDTKSINLNILLGQLSVKYDEALTAEKDHPQNPKTPDI